MHRAPPKLPPTSQKQDESLAAIMARRRAMADSDAAPPSTPPGGGKTKTETIVDPALRALLLKRQQGGGPIEPMEKVVASNTTGPSVWEKAREDLVSVSSGTMGDRQDEDDSDDSEEVTIVSEDHADETDDPSENSVEEEQIAEPENSAGDSNDDSSSRSSASGQCDEVVHPAASSEVASHGSDDSSVASSRGEVEVEQDVVEPHDENDHSFQSSSSQQSEQEVDLVEEQSHHSDGESSHEEEDVSGDGSVHESVGEASIGADGSAHEDSVDASDSVGEASVESGSASQSVVDVAVVEESESLGEESIHENQASIDDTDEPENDLSASIEEVVSENESEEESNSQEELPTHEASASSESVGEQSAQELDHSAAIEAEPFEGNSDWNGEDQGGEASSVVEESTAEDVNEPASVEEMGEEDESVADDSVVEDETLGDEATEATGSEFVDDVIGYAENEISEQEINGDSDEAVSVGSDDKTCSHSNYDDDRSDEEPLDQIDRPEEINDDENGETAGSFSLKSSYDNGPEDLDDVDHDEAASAGTGDSNRFESESGAENDILESDETQSAGDQNQVARRSAANSTASVSRHPVGNDGFRPRRFNGTESVGESSADADEYPSTNQWPSDDDKSRGAPEREDSFFTDPPSVTSEFTFDPAAVDVEAQEPETLSLLEQSLRTLDEERTVDLMETDQEQSTLRSIMFGNRDEQSTVRSYEEQTIASGDQSSLGGQQSFCDEETIYDTVTTDGEQSQLEQNEYSENGESQSEDSENEEFQQYYDNDFEDDSILEIDTLDSSVVSFESHDDVTGWGSSHTPHYKSSLLDQHMQTHDGSNNYQFSDDCEQSILGDLNVLDVVEEEGTVDGSEHDNSTANSPRPVSLASLDSEAGRRKELRTHVGAAAYQVTEVERDSSADSSSSSSGTEDDIETANAKLSKASPRPGSGICSWYILLALILVGSIVLGLGLGLLLIPREKVQDTSPSPTTSPGTRENLPDLPGEQLQVYQLICKRLEGDCSEILLSAATPQSAAFDWLVNNSQSNPNPTTLSEARLLQRYAMATVYFSTKGPDWSTTAHWLSSKHECDWFTSFGFAPICDFETKKLHSFVLENNNLQGEIPFEISLLTSLRRISLRNPGDSGPSIRGSLPSFFGSLTRLTSLSISGNRFASGIPSEFGQLSSLETLDLGQNGLNGEIPPSLAGLTNLERLILKGNFISGDIDGNMFAALKRLEELRLDGNLFSSLPSSLRSLASLRILNAANNDLTTFPPEITELSALLELDLSENDLRGRLPAQLGRLRDLESLNLSGNRFTGPFPVEYCNLAQLRGQLNLSFNSLTGTLPSSVGQLTRLERLLLTGNQLSGLIPAELSFARSMEELRLDQNNFVGALPTEICVLYDATEPSAYVDCAEVQEATCFKHCCTDGAGCRCQYEKTDPFRCIEGLQ